MSTNAHRPAVRLINWWEGHVLRYPLLVVLAFVVGTAWTLRYAMENLSVNANTAEMLSADLPFQKNRLRLEREFPQDISTFLMVVEAATPEQTASAVKELATTLRTRRDFIKSVYIPDEGEFFARNGLLYLDLPKLEALSNELATAQPFIGRLSEDFSLDGLFSIIGDALTHKDQDLDLDLDPIVGRLTDALRATEQNRPYRLSWQQLMMKDQEGLGLTKRLVFVTPVLDYNRMMPAEQSYQAITAAIGEAKQTLATDIRVRLTGEVMLEYEEMATIGMDMIAAGAGSLLLVCLTLWIAFRSFKLMLATMISLTMGLILSLGFAAAAIGQLNMISIAFAVLFIGMGDAYSSHFCLRYRELMLRGLPVSAALRNTFLSTGGSLVLCTMTAAIGLYAFIPTSYVGVAELGMISGTSMFIALGTTFTVLPALIKLMPPKPGIRAAGHTERAGFMLADWPIQNAASIRWITIVLTVIALVLLTRVRVDFNPINLRDPNSESVQTFQYLLKSKDTSPMTLAAFATSEAEVRDKTARFEALPSVDHVFSVLSLIPDSQDEKLAIIEELSLLLGPQLQHFPDTPRSAPARLDSLETFRALIQRQHAALATPSLGALDTALAAFLTALQPLDAPAREALLQRLQTAVLGDLPLTLHNLQTSLLAEPIKQATLPADLRERWVSKDGLYRLQIYPRQDLSDLENLRTFIREAQALDPDVTDLPVTYLESMEAVLQAFTEAFTAAFGAITLLLLIMLRSLRDTVLVLLPLLLASLFTAAMTVVLGIPFNFANIIVLPLLFGLGVDNGIHMAHRLHYLRQGERNLLSTSEAKGVFFGALTTVFSFVSLAFTHHRGTASIGMLLAIGLLLSLVCSLIVLPAFSTWTLKPARRRA
ncbi:MMPL family transporter [Methylotetracoccus oryzae]|uniref:MMPL family transporter n=1 Tax=Methylotetracoccus oryzae TaxID=1919059 RepID=UPI00111B52E2|nr:MMPL family transporter [Methylotetracoccus oryzae]